jgi:hypothetical protein
VATSSTNQSLEELRRQLKSTAEQATRQGAHALRVQLENLQAGLKKLSESLHQVEQQGAPRRSEAAATATPRRAVRRTVRRRQETKTSRPLRRKSTSKKAA